MAIHENELWDLAAIDRNEKLPMSQRNNKLRLEKLKSKVEMWEHRIAIAKPKCRQVLHLIEKFGGILPFAVACNRHPNHIIYKWLGVTTNGTVYKARWGLVPSMGILLRLIVVSRSYGILLRPEDLFPDMIDGDYLRNPHSNPELLAWAMSIGVDGSGGGTSKDAQRKLETELAELIQG